MSQIFEVPLFYVHRECGVGSWKSSRAESFARSFPGISEEIIARLDDVSTHYTLVKTTTNGIVGGFRLTTIGGGSSEIEHIFPNFKFKMPSTEFGGFWISTAASHSCNWWIILRETFRYLSSNREQAYFKTSALRGRAATQRFGAKDEHQEAFNPAMGYTCNLYSIELP